MIFFSPAFVLPIDQLKLLSSLFYSFYKYRTAIPGPDIIQRNLLKSHFRQTDTSFNQFLRNKLQVCLQIHKQNDGLTIVQDINDIQKHSIHFFKVTAIPGNTVG